MPASAFWARVAQWFAKRGITCQRVITDRGACYRCGLCQLACARTGRREEDPTPPATDQRQDRTLPPDRARRMGHIRPWISEAQRVAGYQRFCHFYNQHRSHRALGWQSPMAPHPTRRGQPPRRAQLADRLLQHRRMAAGRMRGPLCWVPAGRRWLGSGTLSSSVGESAFCGGRLCGNSR
jgi:hypothetical protein